MAGTLGGEAFNFLSPENAPRWKGVFVDSIQKIAREVQPSLGVDDEAVVYVEELLFKILAVLCSIRPRSVQDVEEYVNKTFDQQVGKWANKEAHAIKESYVASKQKKQSKPINMPVDKVHVSLCKEVLGILKMDPTVTCYMLGIVEYMGADILKLAGNFIRNTRHSTCITAEAVKVAMRADKVLLDFFEQDMQQMHRMEVQWTDRANMTYDQLVKDMLAGERRYQADLGVITKVYMKFIDDALEVIDKENKKTIMSTIFDSLIGVEDFTAQLLGSLDDTLEMYDNDSEEVKSPLIGMCFEDFAVEMEFGIYEVFAENYPAARDELTRLLGRADFLQYLKANGGSLCSNFREAMRYVMPKMLLEPVLHFFLYFDYIKYFCDASPDPEDRSCFTEALSMMTSLKTAMDEICRDFLPKRGQVSYHRRGPRTTIEQLNELQKSMKSTEPWEGPDIATCCTEILYDGELGLFHHGTRGFGKTVTERRIFILDGLLLCCKMNAGRRLDFRLKEKFNVRRMELADLEDCEEYKHAFEVSEGPRRLLLFAKSDAEKGEWMALLTMLITKSSIYRLHDSLVREEQRRIPLRLPDPSVYKFAVEDNEDNICFEDSRSTSGVPLVKGGTLHKLIERVTYHKFADPAFTRILLTTYRSFCEPEQLLNLLIDRFHIPDPPLTEEEEEMMKAGIKVPRPYMKRFRTEYVQPVQLRVMNVLRHWVEHHIYDFNEKLETKLTDFIAEMRAKPRMKKWIDSIDRCLERRGSVAGIRPIFDEQAPPVEYHIARDRDFNIYTAHPVEIARQLTLIESELYRKVRPSELVGSKWTMDNKEDLSPNVLKFIRHSSHITWWLNRLLVLTENLEERRVAAQRVVEIMGALYELNNFNGMVEVVSALNSSSVHRLEHTFADMPKRLEQMRAVCNELTGNHMKKYKEKLKLINPPCIPFMGDYLTQILFIEQGLKNFLPNGCINFSKRRKVAEITGEIQQYQNQPYNLTPEPNMLDFILQEDPLAEFNGDTTLIANYLHKKSLEIEPRGGPPTKFPRRTTVRDFWLTKKPVFSGRSQQRTMSRPSGDSRRLSAANSVTSPSSTGAGSSDAVTPGSPVEPFDLEPQQNQQAREEEPPPTPLRGNHPKLDLLRPDGFPEVPPRSDLGSLDGHSPRPVLPPKPERLPRPDGPPLRPDGLPPRPDGLPPRPDGLPPRPDGLPPRPDGLPPRPDGLPPRPDGLPPRPDGLPPRPDGLPPRPDGLPPRPDPIHSRSDGFPPRLDRQAEGLPGKTDGLSQRLDGLRPRPEAGPPLPPKTTAAPTIPPR